MFAETWIALLLALLAPLANMLGAGRDATPDAGGKIAACIAALPPEGGICDFHDLTGRQRIAQTITVSERRVTILLGAATYVSPARPLFRVVGPSNTTKFNLMGAGIEITRLVAEGSAPGNLIELGDGKRLNHNWGEVSRLTLDGGGVAGGVYVHLYTHGRFDSLLTLNTYPHSLKLHQAWATMVTNCNFNLMARGSLASVVLDESSNTTLFHNAMFPTRASGAAGLTFTGVPSALVSSIANDYEDAVHAFVVPRLTAGPIRLFRSDSDFLENFSGSPFVIGSSTGKAPQNINVANCGVSYSPPSGDLVIEAADHLEVSNCVFPGNLKVTFGSAVTNLLLRNNQYMGQHEVRTGSVRDLDRVEAKP